MSNTRELTVTIPELHTRQEQVKDEAKRFNVLNCGRRWGKDVLSEELTLDGLLEGKPVAWGSPTYKNLDEVWRNCTEIFAPIISYKNEQQRRMELVTNGSLEFWSLDAPEPIRGRAYARWIINEAASVPYLMDTWNNIIRPTLIDMKGDAWFPSTPKGRNDYYKLHLLGRDPGNAEWKSWTYTSYDNPHLDPTELDNMKTTMTERAYRQEIMAEFLENEGEVFRNIEMSTKAPSTSPEEHGKHRIVAGVDWGRADDFTAISLGCVDCRREVMLDRFNQVDYHFQRMRLRELFIRWGVRYAVGEENAMGDPIITELQRDGINIAGFKTTFVSKAPLIEELALEIEQSRIQLLPDLAAMAELEAYERTTTETGMSKYGAPEGMHDDTVIARALMLRAMKSSPARVTVQKPNPMRELNWSGR